MEVQVLHQKEQQAIFGSLSEMGHEEVLFCNDNATGLKAIIAVHSSVLGPALGGCRMWQYASDMDALQDALRLSRGMTYKAAVAGLNLGGGKSVIIGDARTMKNEALLRRFGRFVENLGGKYITAEDVGMTERDMEHIHLETNHVTGLPHFMGGSGNPSPVTAYGTYLGMKAAMKHVTGSDSLEGKRIMVQGAGSVGSHLIRLVRKENAEVLVYDLYESSAKAIAEEAGARIVKEDEVYSTPVDVYAPCALGGTLNPDTIEQLDCSIVAGAANNQLLVEDRDSQLLAQKGILYAPDFVINAGGLINVALELDTYNQERAMSDTDKIYDTTLQIFKMAEAKNITINEAAIQLAEKRIREVGNIQLYM